MTAIFRLPGSLHSSTPTPTVSATAWMGAAIAALWLAMAFPAQAQTQTQAQAQAQNGMEIVPINVNEASVEVLAELPGIGPSKAQTIVADREANGPFSSLEDLTRVSGIGEVTSERLDGEVSF